MQNKEDGNEQLPRDAKIVKSLLKSIGVKDYDPCVIHQFLELWYRYVVDVLTDSQVHSEHACKYAIDCDDVKLAIQTKVNFSFSQPPPREILVERCKYLKESEYVGICINPCMLPKQGHAGIRIGIENMVQISSLRHCTSKQAFGCQTG